MTNYYYLSDCKAVITAPNKTEAMAYAILHLDYPNLNHPTEKMQRISKKKAYELLNEKGKVFWFIEDIGE